MAIYMHVCDTSFLRKPTLVERNPNLEGYLSAKVPKIAVSFQLMKKLRRRLRAVLTNKKEVCMTNLHKERRQLLQKRLLKSNQDFKSTKKICKTTGKHLGS